MSVSRRPTISEISSINNGVTLNLGHTRSFKVIQNGTIRKLWYDVLLAFHSNFNGPILYRFRDIGWKSRFLYLLPPKPPLGCPRRNIATTFCVEKLEGEIKLMMLSRCDTITASDRQTDGQTNILRQHSLHYASHRAVKIQSTVTVKVQRFQHWSTKRPTKLDESNDNNAFGEQSQSSFNGEQIHHKQYHLTSET